MAIHFAPHLAGEFTGYPEETELVLVRSFSTLPNTWEAIETIPRPYGMLACATLTAEGVEPFTEDDRKDLLTKWAAEFDRLRGEDVAPVAAWVFVELARRGSTRFYAAVRPSAGDAFAHLLNYACHDRHSDWEWLHDENGNRLPGVPKATRSPDSAYDRFEWGDGSAIVADSFTWWFGFHRGRLTEHAVIEACREVAPEWANPAEVHLPGAS